MNSSYYVSASIVKLLPVRASACESCCARRIAANSDSITNPPAPRTLPYAQLRAPPPAIRQASSVHVARRSYLRRAVTFQRLAAIKAAEPKYMSSFAGDP